MISMEKKYKTRNGMPAWKKYLDDMVTKADRLHDLKKKYGI